MDGIPYSAWISQQVITNFAHKAHQQTFNYGETLLLGCVDNNTGLLQNLIHIRVVRCRLITMKHFANTCPNCFDGDTTELLLVLCWQKIFSVAQQPIEGQCFPTGWWRHVQCHNIYVGE